MTTNLKHILNPSNPTEEIRPGYTRVSTILSIFQDFSHIDPEILKRKCRIGTEVHQAIQAFYLHEFNPISSDARGYFDSFKAAFDIELKAYEPKLLEKRLYSETLRITGQIDAIMTKDNSTYLFDWKTSYKANERVWRMQLAMYVMLAEENNVAAHPQCRVLQLTKKNSYRIYEFDLGKKDFEIARALIKSYMYFH